MEWGQDCIQIKTSSDGPMSFGEIKVYENMEYDVKYESPNPDNKPVLEFKSGKPELPTIENRGVNYPPPEKHLDNKIPISSPEYIAKLALSFYEGLFTDAMQKFKKSNQN